AGPGGAAALRRPSVPLPPAPRRDRAPQGAGALPRAPPRAIRLRHEAPDPDHAEHRLRGAAPHAAPRAVQLRDGRNSRPYAYAPVYLTHTRLFTFRSVRHLLRAAGFRIRLVRGVPAPFPKSWAPDGSAGSRCA